MRRINTISMIHYKKGTEMKLTSFVGGKVPTVTFARMVAGVPRGLLECPLQIVHQGQDA